MRSLKEEGLVLLSAGEQDRREKYVQPTEKGTACAAELLAPLYALENRVFDVMGAERIRNMGSVSFAMAAMILGFVTNVTLDYAFVWVFSWGMAGAAWATILGQAVTMIAAVAFFLFRRYRVERLPVKSLRACWGETLKVALSPFGLTFSPTVTMLLMNRFLLLYGSEQSVAVYGCIGYITAIIYLLLQGVGDGCQPLISRYYGERNEADGRRMRSLAYRTALVVSAACMAAVFLAREKVDVLFGASETANAGVAQVLPYFLSTLLFLAFVRITTSCFYATEKTRLSYILVYAEPVCTLLFLLTLPLGLKLTGVWLAVPLAQTAAFLIALLAKRRVERV
ncbi:MAG: MATE family efflux transporter [Eubacteriales bacterium]|nr:MATE family efflux transporter [Eubacteriales bacterium]